MKSGSGDDPFADPFEEDEAEPETESASTGDTADPAESHESDTESATEPPVDTNGASQTHSTSSTGDTETDSSGPDDSHIPWVLRRSSVKDDRPNITQFFLQDKTDRAERRLRSDVEEILDKDVYTLDLREAAYLVAMQHPEEVAETLQDWGYDYLD
jgi:hypothetical protein